MVHMHMWRCILFLLFQNSLALTIPASGRCQASLRSSSLSGWVSLDMVTTSCHNAVSSTNFSSIPYSGKLSRENFCKLVKNTIFSKKFCGLLAFAAPKDTMPQNFAEKTFTNSHTTTKFAKVFSLESFPLYGGVVVCHQSDDTFSTDDTMM